MRIDCPTLTNNQREELCHLLQKEPTYSPQRLLDRTGAALALLAGQLLDDDLEDRPVVLLAGRDSNGAGGLAAARSLIQQGAWVQIVTVSPPETYQGTTAKQLQELQALDAAPSWAEEGWTLPPADLVIDALIGYGLQGELHGSARDLIQLANSSLAPILSLEVPSGLDSESGDISRPHIHATATMAVALPSVGLLTQGGRTISGELYLADIGVPQSLYEKMGLTVDSLFNGKPIIRL